MKKTVSILLILIIFFFFQTSAAPGVAFGHTRCGGGLAGCKVIGETEVIDMVLVTAPDTLIAIEELGETESTIMGSKSVFDTYGTVDVDHLQDELKRTSDFFGQRQDTTHWNVGFSKKVPIGTTTSLAWTNERIKLFGVPTVGGTTIFPTDPTYESVLRFTVSQPLLKNFGGLNDRSTVSQAKKGYEAADLATKYKIAAIANNALYVYWQWVLSYFHMQFWKEAIASSQRFLDITLERKKLGVAEETDVLSAQANLINKKNGYLWAERMNKNVEKELKVVLGINAEDLLDPQDKEPRHIHGYVPDFQGALSTALVNRWDYIALKKEVERQSINVRSTKNQRLPSLDVFGQVALNELRTNYSDAVEDVDSPAWTVGMNFSFPFENRASRAEYKKARHNKSKVEIELEKKENDIANSLFELINRLKINLDVLKNQRRTIILQREKLAKELDKYGVGRSNSEIIIIYQNDKLEAEINALQAWGDYFKTVLDLKLAQNTLINL